MKIFAGTAFLRNHANVSAMAWDFPTSHPMRMKSQSKQKKAPRAVADSSEV
jgi:phage-related protein